MINAVVPRLHKERVAGNSHDHIQVLDRAQRGHVEGIVLDHGETGIDAAPGGHDRDHDGAHGGRGQIKDKDAGATLSFVELSKTLFQAASKPGETRKAMSPYVCLRRRRCSHKAASDFGRGNTIRKTYS